MLKVTVIVPAYNPSQNLVALVSKLVTEFEVLVINDGSDSSCAKYFSQTVAAGATLVEHDKNRGKGAALKTAIAYLQSTGKEWAAVTADADGQHCFKDIKAVAKLTLDYPDCLILGVRDFKSMPARSRFGNSFTRICFVLATHSRVSDTQTGLRGFTYKTADRLITADGDRYEYEMNVLINHRKLGIPIKETVIETIYIDNNSSSHFHPIRDSAIVFAQIIKHIATSLACTVIDYFLYYFLIQGIPFVFGVLASLLSADFMQSINFPQEIIDSLNNISSNPPLWASIPAAWAYLAARIVSAIVNYQLSRRVVFRAQPSWRTSISYCSLALCTVSVGTLLVMVCTKYLGANEMWIKPPIDLALFFVNFFFQKYFVFYETPKNGN